MGRDLPQAQVLDGMVYKLSLDGSFNQSPNFVIKEYCLKHAAIFRDLDELRRRGWENPQGDHHFKVQRSRADHANKASQRMFYNMMSQIADELDEETSALPAASALDKSPAVLDLCMAPGGFTAAVLRADPRTRVCGVSLPVPQGGHHILLPDWQKDSRIQVCSLDITMLAAEMGVTNIPSEHPDAANFLLDRLFHDETFDLAFCDGQVLRTHPRAEYREHREAWRLLTSQLVLAFQRIKKDGKIVVLLHKLDRWNTIRLLYILSNFSLLQLFKPKKKHALRSSFYVVAGRIQSESPQCRAAIAIWKEEWHIATFGSDVEYGEHCTQYDGTVDEVLSIFGPELIRLGQPIWEIQCAALRKASFIT